MIFRWHNRLNQAGDTIVEVLIAMAVISLVLAGAYVATNHNVRSTLDSQEHGQALKLVESQIEFLRNAVQSAATPPPYDFGSNLCFDSSGSETAVAADCRFQANGTTAGPGQEPGYTITITKPTSPSTIYTIQAVWDTPVDSAAGTGKIVMYYGP